MKKAYLKKIAAALARTDLNRSLTNLRDDPQFSDLTDLEKHYFIQKFVNNLTVELKRIDQDYQKKLKIAELEAQTAAKRKAFRQHPGATFCYYWLPILAMASVLVIGLSTAFLTLEKKRTDAAILIFPSTFFFVASLFAFLRVRNHILRSQAEHYIAPDYHLILHASAEGYCSVAQRLEFFDKLLLFFDLAARGGLDYFPQNLQVAPGSYNQVYQAFLLRLEAYKQAILPFFQLRDQTGAGTEVAVSQVDSFRDAISALFVFHEREDLDVSVPLAMRNA